MISIYALTDPRDSRVRYVGKTQCSLDVRYKRHIRESKRKGTHKECWIQSVLMSGFTPGIIVLEECSEDVWQERERHWIASFPEEQLTNMTPGGEGITMTPEVRQKLRGKNNVNPMLTESQVSEIKRMILSCGYLIKDIAERYSVYGRTIENIRNGESWAWVAPQLSRDDLEAYKEAARLRRRETNSTATKLSETEVSEIKTKILLYKYSAMEIAEQYSVTSRQIGAIGREVSWPDVKPKISQEEWVMAKSAALSRARGTTLDMAVYVLQLAAVPIPRGIIVEKVNARFNRLLSIVTVSRIALGKSWAEAIEHCSNEVREKINDRRAKP